MRHGSGRWAVVWLAGVGLAVAATCGLGLGGSLSPHVRADAALAAAVAPRTKAPPYTIERAISDRAPQTTTISPLSALRGATVTITGTRFGAKRGTGMVRFGATKCTRYLSWSATRIRCRVPAAAAYGALAVSVRTARGTSTTTSFTVEEPTPTPSPSPVTESFTLTSSAFTDGGTLPVVYAGDGAGLSPPLAWAGAPAGTLGFAVMMTTLALDGLKWNWVLYDIPAGVTTLAESTAGVGTVGLSSDGPELRYYPPMSKGPGPKIYTFTVYALSAAPAFDVPAAEVNGAILTTAIAPITLASSQMSVTYTRTEESR